MRTFINYFLMFYFAFWLGVLTHAQWGIPKKPEALHWLIPFVLPLAWMYVREK